MLLEDEEERKRLKQQKLHVVRHKSRSFASPKQHKTAATAATRHRETSEEPKHNI